MDSKKDRSRKLNASQLFQAIGEKSRLLVIQLCFEKQRTVEELLTHTKLEKTLLSKHLRVLRESGLLLASKNGRKVTYQINEKIRHSTMARTIDLPCCSIELKDDSSIRNLA